MYRRLGGRINAVDPNREIGFGFVSCSCRACVRAKLCERGREVLLNAGGSNGKKCYSGVGWGFWFLGATTVGFKDLFQILLRKAEGFLNVLLYSLLFAWVLKIKFRRS